MRRDNTEELKEIKIEYRKNGIKEMQKIIQNIRQNCVIIG